MTDDKWCVLVVDDESNNLFLLNEILKDQYRLAFATSGIKALELVKKMRPGLILLDIMMPEVDGYEICRQLKADPESHNIPVIFVSALGEVDDERHGFEVGGVDYITKPVSGPIVKARVKTHLALYDQNRILEELVAERTAQLKRAFEELKFASLDTIYRLTKAAEYKDEDTGSHIQRISHYSAAIARQLKLGDEWVDRILYAAPMHDIGKIGTPDQILLKPGKLDWDEWEIMKQHTTNGAKILERSDRDILKLGETIAETHHEKWDGSGYPVGLEGENIPLAGRIVAVSDVFDALTSKRPYKEPFSLDQSFTIIKDGRGGHFDPDVVDAFFAVKGEILHFRDKSQDAGRGLLI